MSPPIGAPAPMRTVPYTGNSVLHTDEGLSVNGSSCFTPAASQHASLREAGLLRITRRAYESVDRSARMFSSHSLWPRSAMRARLGDGAAVVAVSQFTSLAVVPLARW